MANWLLSSETSEHTRFLRNLRKIIRKYYKQSYSNKFDNTDEMNSFWQR